MILVIKNAALRRILKIALPFVLMPAAIVLGSRVFGEKQYKCIDVTISMLQYRCRRIDVNISMLKYR